jgi:tRNA threonylcarbamoyladenosine biosynthesis protein TsaB
MLILTLRTDKPDAEVGLFQDGDKLDYQQWYAHRELSITLHQRIADMLKDAGKTLKDIEGIVVFKGPGSFTGLRIGLTVANTMAYGLSIPVIASEGDDWVAQGCARLLKGENERIALPFYGGDANITIQKR